jgi:iron complex outermembrane receptor protein
LIVPLALHAQATVRGTVLDQQTGTPVAGALVRVTGTTLSAATSDSGKFVLSSARTITSVTVSRVGYIGKDVALSGTNENIRIELVPSVRDLPGVQVVAHNPAPSTAVLTQSDLDRANGLSLVDAINTVPGVFMQTRTPFGGARITIRGYYPSTSGNSPNSNGLGYQAFFNNIPITDATGTTVLDDIDFSTLGSVQVIKGPASSLYGSAIGGTVNMTTARPAPNQTSVSQQLLGGGDGLMRTNTSFQSANSNSDFTVNYGNQQDNSFRPHSRSRKSYARANGDFTIGSNQAVSAFFSYNRSYEELAGEIDSTDFFARRPVSDANYIANDSHIQITSFFTGVTDSYRINDHFNNQTSVFGTGRFNNQPFAHGFTDATQFNLGARSSFGYTGQIGSVDVAGTLGGMAQRSNVTSNGVFIVPAPPYPERPSATENYAVNGNLFTEWNFSLPAQVTITAGADLIYNTFAIQNMLKNNQLFDTTKVQRKTFPATLAPRIQLSKGFDGNGSVYASVSSGYTPPLLTNVLATDGSVNFGLKPERAVQYEVGAQGSLIDKRLNGQVALFVLDNTDKLVNQTISTITSTTNIGEQRNKGAELSLSYSVLSDPTSAVSLLRPWVSYTYTDAKYVSFKSDNNNTASTVDFTGNTAARVPRTMMSAGIDATTRDGFYLNSTYQFVGRVPVTFDNSTWVHSYNLLNGKIGYMTKIKNRYALNLSVGADNLTNSTYYNFLFVGPNYKGLAQSQDGGTGDGYILPGMYKARYYGNLSVTIPVM